MSTDAPTLPIEVDVAIVGAGFAGIGMAIQLQRQGEHTYVVLERGDGVGGAWRANTYPGVACDVPSHLYSYSFRPNPDWSRVYSPGQEIREYLEAAVADEGITPHLHLDTEMGAARWDAARHRWQVETARGAVLASYLVVATGHLADERMPDVAGLEDFGGPVFHSARWDHATSLAGKRVGVVGTGASAIQIVPSIVDEVAELVLFQRSAPYVQPRRDRAYSAGERAAFARDDALRASVRADLFWTFESTYAARRLEEPYLGTTKRAALEHLQHQVADPDLRRRLTPDYELGCKRVLVSNVYYPALTREHVTVEDAALERLEPGRAISAAGRAFDLDCIVLATGFEATEPHIAPAIQGADGRSLADHWSNGMHALDSITVPSFPNMFLLDGPNTGLGHNSVIFIIESQLQYVLSALAHAAAAGIGVIDAKAAAEADYLDQVAERSNGTVWLDGGCRNWYVDPRSDRITVLWPDFAHVFRERNSTFEPSRYEVTA
ncbi:NAD(P)/FAD-dependent oxidoreductase [Nocardioides sp. QY071]|uniref:flavin-containing monooxygenase n=1 Tax=Nocardioides sp. QY071 TaxID=3044187 RepID=UPI00249C2C84|nr:NAD(P)/FAD-dependent oxidoreductase [Nocardioides sp. QY071]WGY00402.1 NAD(P)/FAD-dependent oxidoreductase [Nocardioides sp. QY071]